MIPEVRSAGDESLAEEQLTAGHRSDISKPRS